MIAADEDFIGSIDNVSVVQVGHLDAALTATSWGASGGLVFDGATSLATVYNHADIAGLTSQAWAFLANAASAGEGDNGTLYRWSLAGAQTRYLASNLYTAHQGATIFSEALASSDGGTLGTNSWSLFAYDNATTRKSTIKVAKNGVISAVTLTSDVAMIGAYVTQTDALILGNNSVASQTFDGTMYAIIVFNGNAISKLDSDYYPALIRYEPAYAAGVTIDGFDSGFDSGFG